MVSIRITTRRCTGIDNSWEKSVWDESICYRCKWAACHDVMNELAKRGYEGFGSDLQSAYNGVQDDTAVTTMPYTTLDITDQETVERVISKIKPDAVVHCAAWTAVVWRRMMTKLNWLER